MDSSIFNGITALDGGALDTAALEEDAVLVVNVASRCGLTPQYEGLERLQKRFADRGFTVLGVPCNQFAEQEPGSAEEILEFCSTTYGTTFPLTEKLEVNGEGRHPLYAWLTETADAEGEAGDDPVELREVPRHPRRGRVAFPAESRAGVRRGGRGDRSGDRAGGLRWGRRSRSKPRKAAPTPT